MVVVLQSLAIGAFAGGIGLAIAALVISRTRRDPGIAIQRGTPRKPPLDSSFDW